MRVRGAACRRASACRGRPTLRANAHDRRVGTGPSQSLFHREAWRSQANSSWPGSCSVQAWWTASDRRENGRAKMKHWMSVAALAAMGSSLTPTATAEACGGFFCGQQPVDQTAERVVFAVDRENNTTDMIVPVSSIHLTLPTLYSS